VKKIFFLLLFLFTITSQCQIWKNYSLSDSTNIYDIAFKDSLFGIAVGDSGLILQTEDGGLNWNRILDAAVKDESLFEVQYIEEDIYISGNSVTEGGFFLVKEGESWEKKIFPFHDLYLTDSYFVNKDTVFICGLSGKFFRSYDGMRNWEEFVDPNNFFANRRVFFLDGKTGWLTGGRIDMIGFLKKTTNGGESWENKLLTIEPMLDIQFLSSDTVFAVGGDPEYGGWIYFSSDAGETWILQQSPPNVITLNCVDFTHNRFGWVTGAGVIIKSTNYGLNWSVEKRSSDFIYKTTDRTERSQWFIGTAGFFYEYVDTTNYDTVTVISDELSDEKEDDGIIGIYPNPANNNSKINIKLLKNSFVEIFIYNILGNEIQKVFSGNLLSGSHSKIIDFTSLSSGVYFVCITFDSQWKSLKDSSPNHFVKKIVVIK